ncbi:MAG TPA: hypothetical protein VGN57_21125 [Pirellulaceae bacterium]|jgi:hypothetical protein|nr:hypothetical protein [Pirellulaceae bacterium]
MSGRTSTRLAPTLAATLFLAIAANGVVPARGEEAVAAERRWGDLVGRIVVKGELPKSDFAKEFAEVCGDVVVYDDSLLVGTDGGLANAFVWLDQTPEMVHPERAAEKRLPVRLAIDGCRIQPHAAVVQTGQTLTFRNLDDVGHVPRVETFVNAAEGTLILPQTSSVGAGRSLERVFERGERTPCPVRCAIYPWMSACVLPTEHPYATTTDANGRFRIEKLPTGELRFRVWHERTGWIEGRFVATTGPSTEVSSKGRFSRSLAGGANDLGTLSVAAESLTAR